MMLWCTWETEYLEALETAFAEINIHSGLVSELTPEENMYQNYENSSLLTHVTQPRAAEEAQIVTIVIPEMLAARLPSTTELSIDNGFC